MEQATSISSSSREPAPAPDENETGMEQVLADLQALKGLYGLLHRGPQPNENLNEASRDMLMKMLDNATQQTLLRQAKLLSGPLMSAALERKLSIQPGRRTSGKAEHQLKPIASPSPSLCASQMSRRLKPQVSVRSRDARSVYDDHRRRERDGRLLARVDSGRSSRTAMPQLHQRTPEPRLSRLASNRSSRVAEPRLHPSTPEQRLPRVASYRSSRVAEPRLRRSTPEQLLSRVASNRSSRVAEPRLRPSTPEQRLSRLGSNRSSRVAEPRLRPSTPEQHISRVASNRSSGVAEPRRGVSRGRAPRADRSDRHSRLRGSSGRGDHSSSPPSSSSPERSSRRRSVSRAPSSHGRATVRGVGAYGSSTRRYSRRLESGLSMGVRSCRGSERAGRGAATPRQSSSSSGEAVTISSRIRPTRELTERRVHESEETGERSLRRRQRKEGAVGGSTSMGWSSRRPRRALDPITSGSTYSSSSSAAASPSPSTSPTAPTSTSAPSASSCSSSVSAPRRGSALPEHGFKEASSASRSRRRRERQERREGRLRMFKEKLALVFHHRHDHHHHHHIGGERSGSPVSRRDRRGNNSKSPWSYLGGLGGMFHRSIGHAAKKTHDAKKIHDAKKNNDAKKNQDEKKKTTSRTVVPVPAPAKKRGGGQTHSLFGALVKHKSGTRKAPARAPTARAGTQSRMQVNKMHWWQLLRQQHARAQGKGRPLRRLGQGKAP
ncbi:unnamed protein product [Triticum turgidum subsp. durum]|uniref:Uncharacterized protein n=1 Tax=Triticum turgidum subsp. durum TaxID=4567 RepID=A0A9R1PXF2_TRITD|nr:unnamed protein product [Triticum turgidum subsp. durum]